MMLVTHDPEVTAHARRSIHIQDGLIVSGAAGRGAGPAGGAA
jgi:ABC-type lipoprotein export system ATPase subunit